MAIVEAILGLLDNLVPILALWGGVLLVLASGVAMYQGWSRRSLSTTLRETPQQDVAAVTQPGWARIRGECTPAMGDDTIASPFTGTDCVLAAWEIEEMYDTPKTTSWERAAWGVTAVPFAVNDDTGELRVEIPDRVVSNETADVFTPETILASEGIALERLRCEFDSFDVVVETDHGEPPPEGVREFLTTTDGVSVSPMATDLVVDESKRRYREAVYRPGDTVSAVGTVVPRHGDMAMTQGPGDLVLKPDDETPLRLSTTPLSERPTGLGALAFGVVTGLLGLALLGFRFLR